MDALVVVCYFRGSSLANNAKKVPVKIVYFKEKKNYVCVYESVLFFDILHYKI
jgi:hypothetical protein